MLRKILCLMLALWISPAGAEPLQTQYHSNGSEASALKASISNQVLTVVIRYNNTSGAEMRESYPIEEVYYIDPGENKKYHVLKDENGKWIANPVSNHGRIGVVGRDWDMKIKADAKAVVWFKFPEPASGANTINLVIPNLTPFDGLPIKR